MKDNIKESILRITKEINSLKIPDEMKKKMSEVLQAICDSANGRVCFPQKDSSYYEYLTLRNKNGLADGPLELCFVTRTINPISKTTESRTYDFPSLMTVVERIQNNLKYINSEIANANYHQQLLTSTPKVEDVTTKPVKVEFREIERVKAQVAKMNIPSYKKQRTIEALNSIMNSPRKRLHTKKVHGLEEYIAVRSETLTLVKKYDDPLSIGSNKTREYKTLHGMALINYIEENRETIDEEIKRGLK